MERDVAIVSRGRLGNIIYKENDLNFEMEYEFGGVNCVAMINVPTKREWEEKTPFKKNQRNEILVFIANEVIRNKAQGCNYLITENEMFILEHKKEENK
ncbi:MAG: hypothetical protein KAI43_09085 [Candidatus Aureabacteria bacterium]|nr:hypothetical protein [Candidatus Auribacterota bacterium]